MELSLLINKFNLKGRLVALEPFGNGNINDTFLAIYRNTFTETQVILQKVNRKVFPVPEAIMSNMHEITKHCHEKLEADAKAGRDDRVWQMPRIVKAKELANLVSNRLSDSATRRVIPIVIYKRHGAKSFLFLLPLAVNW